MSGVCRDCKFWFTDLNPDEGICALLGDWPYKEEYYGPEPDKTGWPEAKAHAIPFLQPGNFEACFAPSPDFGCDQFQEDDELVEFEEIIHLNFESRLQRAYTARGRAFEQRWREFEGAMEDYDYGWRRTPEYDKRVPSDT